LQQQEKHTTILKTTSTVPQPDQCDRHNTNTNDRSNLRKEKEEKKKVIND